LSTISGRPLVITEIRSRHEQPGLRDHEASFIRLLDKLCDGSDVSIDETGTSLRYRPGQIIGGQGLVHNCPATRGLTYFLEVTNGGPDMTCDTFRTATLPLLAKFGLTEELVFKVLKRGARPGGGGEVVFNCPTLKSVQPVEILNEGKVKRVRGVAYTTHVSPQFASIMVDAARGVLNDFLPDVWIYTDHSKGSACGESPGYGISLVAETITRCLKSADAVPSWENPIQLMQVMLCWVVRQSMHLAVKSLLITLRLWVLQLRVAYLQKLTWMEWWTRHTRLLCFTSSVCARRSARPAFDYPSLALQLPKCSDISRISLEWLSRSGKTKETMKQLSCPALVLAS